MVHLIPYPVEPIYLKSVGPLSLSLSNVCKLLVDKETNQLTIYLGERLNAPLSGTARLYRNFEVIPLNLLKLQRFLGFYFEKKHNYLNNS